MNGSVHDPHAHKRTSINELLNPVASSTAIDHSLPPQTSSYSNGNYPQNTPYTHPGMPPPSHHRTANGTAYKLNPASWDGADHDRQRIDHMPSPRGFAPGVLHSPGAYQEYHAHLSRAHEDGFSEPSAVWSSPTGRLDGLPPYASPTITQSSYSDERTSIPNDPSATAGSSPYPPRPDSATYGRLEFHPSAYSQRPPQPAAVFGAWPHHVRSPGVPATRGLTDHPHAQHPHLPPHPYLSHPAFYSPIPHPSMLYPYMAHPYPPPPASLPESPPRKRAGQEETQNSRSKRKRLNARDAVETNGSRRGYTANKRNQAAQIAAQNAQLQAYTPGSGPNTNDSRTSATDRNPRAGNENSSGGADGNGPYHPELQFARCMSNRYKSESFPRCVSCTRRWAGDTCRFQGIRFFLKDEKQNIVGVSFVENQKADSPTMKFPTRWNRPLDAAFIREIKLTVARALLPTLKEEQEHLRKPEIIRRPRDSDVRATCDTCMTSIFSSSWMCRLCGREACSECFVKVRELTQYRPGASDSEIAALQAKRESHAHTNPFFLSCTRRNEHQYSDFSPMSRFDKAELEGVIESMEKLLQEESVRSSAPAVSPSSDKDGVTGAPDAAQAPDAARASVLNTSSSFDVVTTVGGSSSVSRTGPAPSSPQPVQTALNGSVPNGHAIVEDPSGIPSHSTRTYTTADLTDAEFRKVWPLGAPLVMTGLGEKFGIRWRPDHFRDKHGSQTCSIVECQTDASKRVTVGEFFGNFGKYEGRTDHWKLKDWPSSSDFKTALPDLFEEIQKGVPMPNYTRRDGVLNIASHFPSNTVMPDLGPKLYIAQATNDEEGSKGSTRLHMDMADGVNIMVHSEARPDGSPGVAAWDLFRAEDADRLRKFLKRRFGVNGQHDPILSQQYYLDAALRKELYDDYGIKSHRVYQRPGDAVFIPAGCAHQVANLADSIKVAVDFVSPKNIARCEKLTGEFREQNQSMVWKEDSLQLRTMMWFAWLSCTRQEEEIDD